MEIISVVLYGTIWADRVTTADVAARHPRGALGVAGRIIWAWILMIPASTTVAALFFLVTHWAVGLFA